VGACRQNLRRSRVEGGGAEEFLVEAPVVIRGWYPEEAAGDASEFSHHFKTAEAYGWTVGDARVDWAVYQ